tara:strand:- start:2784 stop:4385 length:1602 start_codon:yes stop_codon:yes gene_type:complete
VKYLVLKIIVLYAVNFFAQQKTVSLGEIKIVFPEINGYKECKNNKISKLYSDNFIPKNYTQLALYLNNESFKHNRLSSLYDGLSDFGYFMALDLLKKEYTDNEYFKEILKFQDSLIGDIDNNFNIEMVSDDLYLANPKLIDVFDYGNKLKSYRSLISIDSLNLYSYIENHLNLKNRYIQFIYYVKIKNRSDLEKAISNNNYIVRNVFEKNGFYIPIENSKHIRYNSISVDDLITKDGFNLGNVTEFANYLSNEKEFVDINGIKIKPSQFWECNVKFVIPNLYSDDLANAIEKSDFDMLLPDEEGMNQIMSCIGDDFSVGESYVNFCIERYLYSETFTEKQSRDFCSCEYEKLKLKVNNYQDYMDYFDEIGDPNKPSYNEIILPCRNTIIKESSINQYISSDVEGFNDQSIIKLIPDGTTFKIKLIFDGIARYLLFDTGASELVINKELEQELYKKGAITSSDYIDSKKFEIADGTFIESRGIKLNNIVIGGYRVNNIVAYVNEEGGMLCGMGLMNKFRTWEFNKDSQMLTVYK